MQTQNKESQQVSNPTHVGCARDTVHVEAQKAPHYHIYIVCQFEVLAQTQADSVSLETQKKKRTFHELLLNHKHSKHISLVSEIYFVHSASNMPLGSWTQLNPAY